MLDWIKNKTSSKNRKQFGKYNFSIKSQPQIIDSSSTINLTIYQSKSESATIPCRFRWSIIKNGLTLQVPQFRGSSFICEPSDVGSIVQAQVISTDSEYNGTAIVQFGPVKLDVSLKKQIQIALASGSATMPIYLINNQQEKQCQIRLYEDVIKVNHAYSDANYTFDYSIFQPKIQCVAKDSNKLIILFSQKYQNQLRRFLKKLFNGISTLDSNTQFKRDLTSSVRSSINYNTQQPNNQPPNRLELKFMNRNSRDIFLYTMKAFITKKQLRSSVIINKIQRIDFNNEEVFDYVLQIQGLKSQLVKMDSVVRKSQHQKHRYMEQVNRLQKQIQEIIVTYTRIVQQKFKNQMQLSKDYSMLSNKRDQIVTKKYIALQNQNNHLNSRIQCLTQEIDKIRFKPTTTTSQNQFTTVTKNINVPNVHFDHFDHRFQELQVSPFLKKYSSQQHTNFVNILDQLSQSRVSGISSIRQDGARQKLDKLSDEKQQLQKKLDKSFQKIDSLQKQLYQKQNNSSNNLNNSAIHFTYGRNGVNIDDTLNFANQKNVNKTTIYDSQKDILALQNNQLKKINQSLVIQKNELIDLLTKSRPTSPKNQNVNFVRYTDPKVGNSLNFLKTHKKQELTASRRQSDLQHQISKKQVQIKRLTSENQSLKQNNNLLKKALQDYKNQRHQSQYSLNENEKQKYIKKITQLQQQVQMYRKNADALNRSQHLSMEMDNYNDQQLKMLKQHNQFLTNQNEKLSRACEKYMSDAKQSTKLRHQIIKLKEKVNQLMTAAQNSRIGF